MQSKENLLCLYYKSVFIALKTLTVRFFKLLFSDLCYNNSGIKEGKRENNDSRTKPQIFPHFNPTTNWQMFFINDVILFEEVDAIE